MLVGAKDELYGVDTLNRLTLFDRGDLNANKNGLTGAAVKYQDWTLDKVGNWPYFYDNSATAWPGRVIGKGRLNWGISVNETQK